MTEPAWCSGCNVHRVASYQPGALCPVCIDSEAKKDEDARRSLGWE